MNNPIFEQYFDKAGYIGTRTHDGGKSVMFRKHLAMSRWLEESKPGSMIRYPLVERIGNSATSHVLLLNNEGSALRQSSSMRMSLRAPNRAKRAEKQVRFYLNTFYRTFSRLKNASI